MNLSDKYVEKLSDFYASRARVRRNVYGWVAVCDSKSRVFLLADKCGNEYIPIRYNKFKQGFDGVCVFIDTMRRYLLYQEIGVIPVDRMSTLGEFTINDVSIAEIDGNPYRSKK